MSHVFRTCRPCQVWWADELICWACGGIGAITSMPHMRDSYTADLAIPNLTDSRYDRPRALNP